MSMLGQVASHTARDRANLHGMLARKDIPEDRMTVDEFYRWVEGRPREAGRFELHDGRIVAMAPERMAHVIVKAGIYSAMRRAVRAAAVPCRALTEGLGVRMSDAKLYIPDAMLVCGATTVEPARLEIEPTAVFEVASPSTEEYDETSKLPGYLAHATIRHVVFVYPAGRLAVHHRRIEPGRADTRVLNEGDTLLLDPPGIAMPVAAFFEELE